MFVPLDAEVERIAENIVDAVGDVRHDLGRGLLERGYAGALEIELSDRGHAVEREIHMPLTYKGRQVTHAYRLDLWVDRTVVVECKTVDELRPEHYAQVLTYLKMTGNRLGFLVNFHATPLRTGIKRVIR